MTQKNFLFLQGPISPFFKKMADHLKKEEHHVLRVNFCFGDWLIWSGENTITYRGKIKNFKSYIEKIYKKNHIDEIVLLGEKRPYHKIAIEVAHELDIKVVVTDLGYLRPDWVTLELNGISGDSIFERDPEKIKHLSQGLPFPDLNKKFNENFLYDAGFDFLYNLSNIILKPFYPFYCTHLVRNPLITYAGILRHIIIRKFLKKSTDKIITKFFDSKYFLIPMQLDQDYQVRAYSSYSSILGFLSQVINSFANYCKNQEAKLIIKIHPLDPMLVRWKKRIRKIALNFGVDNRVFFITSGDTDRLIESSQGVITINSTVGVKSVILGVPTITMGESAYEINGLVNPSGYLNDFWNIPIAPDPSLVDAYLRLLSQTTQVRGGYYEKNAISHAAKICAERLSKSFVNKPFPIES